MMATGIGIDPLDFNKHSKLMRDKTFNKYSKTWMDFVKEADIRLEKPPTKADFEAFFEGKRNSGLSGNSVRCLYSHVNKMYNIIYGRQLLVSITKELKSKPTKFILVLLFRISMVTHY